MFSEAKVRRVTQFIECLKHTKGEFHGEPFKLLPWQEKIMQAPPPPQGQVDEGGDHGYSDQRHTKAGGIGLFMVIAPPTPRPSWGDSRSLSFADDPIVHSVLSAICLGIRPGNHMNHQRVTALERISSD